MSNVLLGHRITRPYFRNLPAAGGGTPGAPKSLARQHAKLALSLHKTFIIFPNQKSGQEIPLPIRRSNSGCTRTFPICCLLLLFALIASGSQLRAQNQNIEVRNAGGGNKEELVRNAAGQVVETRTIDANGKVRSRNTVDFQPGQYAPNTTTTSYYPDGKSVENVVKVTYDRSANFVGEIVEQYEQSGKHLSGHKILHDPVTGMFRCWKWSADSQKYDRIVCPSGEESGEKQPPLKRLSQEEAVKQFEAARTAATAQEKAERMTPKNLVQPPVIQRDASFAIVLPAALLPGKQVSGSVVENTHYISLRPELIVEPISLPLVPGGDAQKLSGWRIEVAGSQPQRADNPFSFTVPAGASAITIKIYPDGQPAQAISKSIPVPKSPPAGSKPKSGYVAQAVCVIGDVCPLGGTFDGNATTALASFGDKPAAIVAETTEMVFVGVPEDLLYGVKQLLFNEGNELLAFPVVVVQMQIVSDGSVLEDFQRELKKDDHKLLFAGVVGVQNLPDEDWTPGMFPKTNLEWARRFVPGFEVPHETHAEREEREMMEKLERQQKGEKAAANEKEKEEKLGSIVFFLKNTAPDIGTWRDSKAESFVVPLNPESFSQGDYRYKFVVDATKGGTSTMQAALIPFVAPVQGQKFTLPSASSK